MLGDALLDLLDRHPPVVGPEQIVQHLLGRLQRDVAADKRGVGDDPVERALELADVGDDLVGQELENLERHGGLQLVRLGLQYGEPEFVVRLVDVGHQPPAQARAHPLLHALEVRRRLVGGNDDLPVLVDQGVESVEELLLCGLSPRDELDIVDHQHVHRAELILERHGVAVTKRPDELVHEFFGRKIDDPAGWIPRPDVPGDGMHQMGLAKADPAIEEQRVERHRRRLGDPPRGGVGKFVGLADDEILECQPGIEWRADIGLSLRRRLIGGAGTLAGRGLEGRRLGR